MMQELITQAKELEGKIAIDQGRRGFDEAAAVIYEANTQGLMVQTVVNDLVVVNFLAEQQTLIENLVIALEATQVQPGENPVGEQEDSTSMNGKLISARDSLLPFTMGQISPEALFWEVRSTYLQVRALKEAGLIQL